jgi:hypothetical protein
MTTYYLESELQDNSRLILCIGNKTRDNDFDTTLFIGWDTISDDYFIKGRRHDTDISDNVPYSFHTNFSNLYDFIELIFGKNAKCSLTLYNFNNIDCINDKITYEFFESNMDPNYEIVSYDCELHRKNIGKALRLLKNVYNWEPLT